MKSKNLLVFLKVDFLNLSSIPVFLSPLLFFSHPNLWFQKDCVAILSPKQTLQISSVDSEIHQEESSWKCSLCGGSFNKQSEIASHNSICKKDFIQTNTNEIVATIGYLYYQKLNLEL